MSIKRLARLGGVALVGALALTACGSDDNSSTGAGEAARVVAVERHDTR